MPEEYLNSNLYDWLRKETGYTEFDLLEMSDLATYVWTAAYHGIELKFPLSQDHVKWCQVSSD